MERPPTDSEWIFALRGTFEMQLRQSSSPEAIGRLWNAFKFLLEKLDERMITHDLCDLVPNVCMTMLDPSRTTNERCHVDCPFHEDNP